MAPAHVASASTNTDSIKGLAQSIAKPAYRRLLGAETVLRRAVPVLIVTFLVTVAIGAGLQVHDNRRQVIAAVVTELDLLAGPLAERINLAAHEQRADVDLRHIQDSLTAFAGRMPFKQRDIVVSDASGLILAASSSRTGAGRPLVEIIGPDHLFVTFAKGSHAREILLADGTEAFATVRPLRTPLGHLAVIEPSARALARWRSDTTLTVTLSATTGFVALILGFAFHWQATRAREADLIYDTVRRRIDTALNRGRCGLWDWDLARGRIFWSQSMFAILGLDARDDLLAFGDVNELVHPEDVDLYALAAELADGRRPGDRPRLPHAPRARRLGVAAGALRNHPAAARRAGRTSSASRSTSPSRRSLVERTAGRRPAAARRDRDHPGSVRAVGCRQPAGAVQFELPGAAQPLRRRDRRRHLLRGRARGRTSARRCARS